MLEDAAETSDAAAAKMSRDSKLTEVYEVLKEYPIYQGLTTDGIWEPRAVVMQLRPRMEMWANHIDRGHYYE